MCGAVHSGFLARCWGCCPCSRCGRRCAVGEDVGVAAARCCVCGGKTYFGMPRQEQQQLPVLQSGASFAAGAGFGQAVRQDADNVAARCERGEHGGFVHTAHTATDGDEGGGDGEDQPESVMSSMSSTGLPRTLARQRRRQGWCIGSSCSPVVFAGRRRGFFRWHPPTVSRGVGRNWQRVCRGSAGFARIGFIASSCGRGAGRIR